MRTKSSQKPLKLTKYIIYMISNSDCLWFAHDVCTDYCWLKERKCNIMWELFARTQLWSFIHRKLMSTNVISRRVSLTTILTTQNMLQSEFLINILLWRYACKILVDVGVYIVKLISDRDMKEWRYFVLCLVLPNIYTSNPCQITLITVPPSNLRYLSFLYNGQSNLCKVVVSFHLDAQNNISKKHCPILKTINTKFHSSRINHCILCSFVVWFMF